MGKNKFWIGIGASAGGLDAIKDFLKHLEFEDSIYIIAQHLDPSHPTILKELLEKVTSFPIYMVEEDIKPEKGSIYIIAPGHNATIEKEHIILSPAAIIGPKPSVNDLFCSMADEIKEFCIGIILSGTGSDGAVGISAIKAAGGITIAQDNQSAKYSGMPRSAMDTGFVDLVLSPKEIASELPKLIYSSKENIKRVTEPKVRTNLEKIFQAIFDQTSYDFSGYKLKTIQRRIQRRMVVNKFVTLDDYVELLSNSSNEVEALFKDLLISVTDFFRDKEAFDDLKVIVDNMIDKRDHTEPIRVWVAGCANGAEAYSMAILFEEANRKLNKQIPFQIFATDIDDYALNLGRKAVYSSSQTKEIKPNILKRYFQENDASSYMINKTLRDHVVFAKQNMITDPPFSHIDLVSCRNVLIYFNNETQKKIFQTFHYSLKPDCFLFLGKSESASNTSPELFEVSTKKSQLFKRRKTELSFNLEYTKGAKKLVHNQKISSLQSKVKINEDISLKDKMNQVINEKLMPASIVINSMGEMLHINGNLNPYLTFPEGRLELNILNMAKGDLKIDIRSLLQQAKRDGRASSQALFHETKNKNTMLYIAIEKIHPDINDELFVLAFFELQLSYESSLPVNYQSIDDLSKDKLKQEIEIFRERLQSSIQDLETSNEELQSTNEELQSANEEMQSANEELQTANEELQSTNEELSTVNEELEVKSFELGKVNNDLTAMLSSIDDNILFVDNRLRLQRYTNKAGKLFELLHDDIGQVITSFSFSMDIPNLRAELINVIEMERECIINLRNKSLQHDLRIVPYKFDNREVVGAILFFEKIKNKTEISNKQHENFMNVLGKYTKYPMVCVNIAMEFVHVNFLAEELFGYSNEEFTHMSFEELFLNMTHNQIENTIFKNDIIDSDGWSSITIVTKEKEKKVVRFKYENCPDQLYTDRVIFFKFA
ncbi:CheR family methyltransferase [Arcobacter sp. LA11]|uniref:CheR family methyltransferase n=1 Tax=Arcobacter sp. LA11 TaxID=1898176 RepID=UPI0009323984|nr:CheR family methyltransferase [Arcobacter sp. LA11]